MLGGQVNMADTLEYSFWTQRFQKWPQIYSNTLQNVTLFSTVTSISLYLIERGQLEQKVTSVTPIILSRNI